MVINCFGNNGCFLGEWQRMSGISELLSKLDGRSSLKISAVVKCL